MSAHDRTLEDLAADIVAAAIKTAQLEIAIEDLATQLAALTSRTPNEEPSHAL